MASFFLRAKSDIFQSKIPLYVEICCYWTCSSISDKTKFLRAKLCSTDSIFLFNSRLVSFTKNSMLLVPFSAFVRRREISSDIGNRCNEEKVADCGNWSLWVEIHFSIETSLIELSSSFCRKSVCSGTTVSMLDMALVMVISDRLIHWSEVPPPHAPHIESWLFTCSSSRRTHVKSRFMCKIARSSLLGFLTSDFLYFLLVQGFKKIIPDYLVVGVCKRNFYLNRFFDAFIETFLRFSVPGWIYFAAVFENVWHLNKTALKGTSVDTPVFRIVKYWETLLSLRQVAHTKDKFYFNSLKRQSGKFFTMIRTL